MSAVDDKHTNFGQEQFSFIEARVQQIPKPPKHHHATTFQVGGVVAVVAVVIDQCLKWEQKNTK